MFDSLRRLVEQQNTDGEIRHHEFDPPPAAPVSFDTEGRARLIDFIISTTPERHRFESADGQVGIVYFDSRGRAVSAVLSDLDDDTLQWITQSRKMDGQPLPKSDPGYPQPTQEDEIDAKTRTLIEVSVFAGLPPDQKRKKDGRMYVLVTGEMAEAVGRQANATVYLDELSNVDLMALGHVMGLTEGGSGKKDASEKAQAATAAASKTRYEHDKGAYYAAHSAAAKAHQAASVAHADEASKRGDSAQYEMHAKKAREHSKQSGMHKRKADEVEEKYRTEDRVLAEGVSGKFWQAKEGSIDQWFYPLEQQKNGGWAGLLLDLSFSKKPKKKSVHKRDAPGPTGVSSFYKVATPPDEIIAMFKAHPDFPRQQVSESKKKTTYVLKNHNGTELSRHTDPSKLASEMLKYETQTGNQTRIEVLHDEED